jgi:hypothetical protein
MASNLKPSAKPVNGNGRTDGFFGWALFLRKKNYKAIILTQSFKGTVSPT